MRNIFPIIALNLAAALCAAAPGGAEALRPLCPDRPGKGTSPCTLDAGHFQMEIDAFDGSYQRTGGVTSDTVIAISPTLKYGLSDSVDVEATVAPYISQRTHDTLSDTTISGFGDLYLRGKWNFLGDSSLFAAVLEPFIKIATARRGLGDGATEEGLVLPLSYDLGGNWSLASTPEMDIIEDVSGSGRHTAMADVIGLGRTFENGLTLGAELWTSQDFDPSGTTSQYSFDLDAAWQPRGDADLQLDIGVNLGLNRNAPGSQICFGISRRF